MATLSDETSSSLGGTVKGMGGVYGNNSRRECGKKSRREFHNLTHMRDAAGALFCTFALP